MDGTHDDHQSSPFLLTITFLSCQSAQVLAEDVKWLSLAALEQTARLDKWRRIKWVVPVGKAHNSKEMWKSSTMEPFPLSQHHHTAFTRV
jgi:hypothetical protein